MKILESEAKVETVTEKTELLKLFNPHTSVYSEKSDKY